MAMIAGGTRGGFTASINMTPMIDVLLVLLIIFMVVQASLQRGLSVHVPAPKTDESVTPAGAESLVLEVEPGGRYALNRKQLDGARLTEELQAVFANRPRKLLYVKASEQLSYGEVIHAFDASRAAGVDIIGLMPRN
jgi:biopolymer transport protein ExbD/biopolymer transport protein TolR